MKLIKPKFWDHKNFISLSLFPLSLIIQLVIFFKKKFTKMSSFKIPIVCIGNIYIGGTGKTPSTIKLFQILEKIYKKVTTAKKFYYSQRDEISLLKKKNWFLKNVIIILSHLIRQKIIIQRLIQIN